MAYELLGLKPNAKAGAEYFGKKYGIKTIYGIGPGSVIGSDHPAGLATDFMINNISSGRSVGDALAADAIANKGTFNVKYVIWYKRIDKLDGKGWQPYSGPSDHTDHVHVSYYAGAGSGTPTVGVGNPLIPDSIEKLADFIGDPATWRKAAFYVGGSILVIGGVVLMVGSTPIGKAVIK